MRCSIKNCSWTDRDGETSSLTGPRPTWNVVQGTVIVANVLMLCGIDAVRG